MAAVDLDRQAIERRDFPIARRGYDAVAVDAHLRSLAVEFEELQRAASGAGADVSLAATASSQVQSIIQAAETAAAEIERQALADARTTRDDADRDARRTRDDAVEKARAHVAAVAQATAQLLERVGAMDGEAGRLIQSLQAGASKLGRDLDAVKTGMEELYDASSGRSPAPTAPADPDEPRAGAPEGARPFAAQQPPVPQPRAPEPPAAPPPAAVQPPPAVQPPAVEQPPAAQPPIAQHAAPAPSADLDGARLVALNMALNGQSRGDTERYLAENFDLADRAKLVDEVYAAIEG
jgi:hypothetical protein